MSRQVCALFMMMFFVSCAVAPVKPSQRTEEQTRLLSLISNANPVPNAVRMSGRVEVSSTGGPAWSNATIAVERPNNLRAVFHDSFGMAWFLLVVNEKNVFYASPNDGKSELSKRMPGVPVSFGAVSIVPEDVINNIYPSFDPRELEGARLDLGENGLKATWPEKTLELSFDERRRILSAVTKHSEGKELRFDYAYGDGTLNVKINSEIGFEFSKIEKLSEAPAALFTPPDL